MSAIRADEAVVPVSAMKELRAEVRELERLLGRETMEVEILKDAVSGSPVKKTDLSRAVAQEGRCPMKAIAEITEASRSNQYDKERKPRQRYRKAGDGPE